VDSGVQAPDAGLPGERGRVCAGDAPGRFALRRAAESQMIVRLLIVSDRHINGNPGSVHEAAEQQTSTKIQVFIKSSRIDS
jgi:hypothetical protein